MSFSIQEALVVAAEVLLLEAGVRAVRPRHEPKLQARRPAPEPQ